MEVRSRAPGKIILAGEHAVVHGSTAVAASIDLYTHVTLRFPSSDNEKTLTLHIKDMGLEFSWQIGRIMEALPGFTSPNPLTPISGSLERLASVTSLVEEQKIPEAKIGLASGVSAFLWLYTAIIGYKAATVIVTSKLPLGSGLGSSAAFCVSLSGAMQPRGLSYGESDLELVNKWAFQGEKIIHGKPSGIDNTVSTYGNMIKFRSGILTRLKSTMPLKMLVTNTRVGRNTKALVAGVSKRAIRHQDAMEAVFSAVDSISKEVSTIIQSPATDDVTSTEQEAKLEELMEMNQGLLQCMGVSHASIETVLRTTLKYKLSSKLTGAGGGGCVLTLLPTLLSATVVDKVTADLESCGFQCMIATIGGPGLEICFKDTNCTVWDQVEATGSPSVVGSVDVGWGKAIAPLSWW
ncbi:Mevalonate kinase-like protein [Drosera capensis]